MHSSRMRTTRLLTVSQHALRRGVILFVAFDISLNINANTSVIIIIETIVLNGPQYILNFCLTLWLWLLLLLLVEFLSLMLHTVYERRLSHFW